MVPAAAFWSRSQPVLAGSSAEPLAAPSAAPAPASSGLGRPRAAPAPSPALQALPAARGFSPSSHAPGKGKTTLLGGSRGNSKCSKNVFNHPQPFFARAVVNHQLSSTSSSSLSSPFSSSYFHFLARDSDQWC